ncbi:hypothetical protein [Amycolatopsis sp. VC5-11]|uniref:hypothetical protein n=1 Tax=Amycolatopsis sp. VC5-11 TaxID=3120156 RepID=UPI0030089CCA
MAGQRDSREADGRPRSETVNNPRNFWRTTGLATVLAAAMGVAGTLLAQQMGKKDPAPGPAETSRAPSAPQKSSAPMSASDPSEAAPSEIRWQGKFALTSYPDFESLPPKDNAGGSMSQDIYGTLYPSGGGAVWTGSRPPSKQECSDLADTQSREKIDPVPGTQVCLKTRGRVVYFKVVGAGERENWVYRYQTQLIVWN